jgi:hypothetical protein
MTRAVTAALMTMTTRGIRGGTVYPSYYDQGGNGSSDDDDDVVLVNRSTHGRAAVMTLCCIRLHIYTRYLEYEFMTV